METIKARDELLSLTLVEHLALAERVIDDLELTISLGEMWMQKKSDVSYSASEALAQVSYCHKRLMAVRSQLQYWTASNGYATTLPASKLLTSWCAGSVLLMALIDVGLHGLFWSDVFDAAVPTLTADIKRDYLAE